MLNKWPKICCRVDWRFRQLDEESITRRGNYPANFSAYNLLPVCNNLNDTRKLNKHPLIILEIILTLCTDPTNVL